MLIQASFAFLCSKLSPSWQGGVTRRMGPVEVLGKLYECFIVFSGIQHGTL